MKMGYYLTRPCSLAVLYVLVIWLLNSRPQAPTPADRVLAVLRAQQVVATECTPVNRLLLLPYAKWIARIDATECPDDFFKAWEKYVSDVHSLSKIERAETGKAIASIGVVLITGSEHPGQVEIARNTAAADWQYVQYVALRYGIKTVRV